MCIYQLKIILFEAQTEFIRVFLIDQNKSLKSSNEIYLYLIMYYSDKVKYKKEINIFETWQQTKYNINHFDIIKYK